MFRHLLHLVWNRKRRNILMTVEIFFAFIILFAVFATLFLFLERSHEPVGFDHRDVWVLGIVTPSGQSDSLRKIQNEIIMNIQREFPEIEASAFSDWEFPYSENHSTTSFDVGNQAFEGEAVGAGIGYDKVLRLNVVEGRWFEESDNHKEGVTCIVLNRVGAEMLSPGESVVGKKYPYEKNRIYEVVGVVDHYKNFGEFTKESPTLMFLPGDDFSQILLRMKPGTTALTESRIMNRLSGAVKNVQFNMQTLESMREKSRKMTLTTAISLVMMMLFLVFNVALGLFGIIWLSINRRKSEIGLRRALGATMGAIRTQYVGEVFVLMGIAISAATLLVIQIPILGMMPVMHGSVFWCAYGAALIFIYGIGFFCSWYPGSLAARIEPAMALHEE